jgi:hypothetical protein
MVPSATAWQYDARSLTGCLTWKVGRQVWTAVAGPARPAAATGSDSARRRQPAASSRAGSDTTCPWTRSLPRCLPRPQGYRTFVRCHPAPPGPARCSRTAPMPASRGAARTSGVTAVECFAAGRAQIALVCDVIVAARDAKGRMLGMRVVPSQAPARWRGCAPRSAFGAVALLALTGTTAIGEQTRASGAPRSTKAWCFHSSPAAMLGSRSQSMTTSCKRAPAGGAGV